MQVSQNNLEVLHLDKYQTYVRTCSSAPSKTSVIFREHLVTFSLTAFAHASKLNLQPNINFKS